MNKTIFLVFFFTYGISIIFGLVFGESTGDKITLMFATVAALFSGTLYLDFWSRNGKS